MSKNEITGDHLHSGHSTQAYQEGFDIIQANKQEDASCCNCVDNNGTLCIRWNGPMRDTKCSFWERR